MRGPGREPPPPADRAECAASDGPAPAARVIVGPRPTRMGLEKPAKVLIGPEKLGLIAASSCGRSLTGKEQGPVRSSAPASTGLSTPTARAKTRSEMISPAPKNLSQVAAAATWMGDESCRRKYARGLPAAATHHDLSQRSRRPAAQTLSSACSRDCLVARAGSATMYKPTKRGSSCMQHRAFVTRAAARRRRAAELARSSRAVSCCARLC